jgi:hypothetical protein
MEDVAACDASNVAKREVAATSNSYLGLAADQRSVGTRWIFTVVLGRRKKTVHGAVSLASRW